MTEEVMHGYRVVYMNLLGSVFNRSCCLNCFKQTLALEENSKNNKGLKVVGECGLQVTEDASEECEKGFEFKPRIVFAVRACCQGFRGVERFATF